MVNVMNLLLLREKKTLLDTVPTLTQAHFKHYNFSGYIYLSEVLDFSIKDHFRNAISERKKDQKTKRNPFSGIKRHHLKSHTFILKPTNKLRFFAEGNVNHYAGFKEGFLSYKAFLNSSYQTNVFEFIVRS